MPSLPLPYTTEDSEGGINPSDYQVVVLEITSESTSSQLIGVECSPTFGGDSVIPAGINLTTKVYDATSVVKQIDSEESEVETGYLSLIHI